MSYCRWSCNSYQSDIYAYESTEDYFVIHVARNMHVHPNGAPAPKLSDYWSKGEPPEGFAAYYHDVDKWLLECDLVPIDNPFAGETFKLDTAEQCMLKLRELRESGLRVPDHAFTILEDEINYPEEDVQ